MADRVERSGLKVDAALAAFVESEVLAPLKKDVGAFWQGFAALLDDFAPKKGRPIRMKAGNGFMDLMLAEVQPLPPSGRQGGSFRLEFHGPLQPVLPQATYRFDLGGEGSDIFIVPVGQTPQGIRYEAIFF